jgi:hypothetical protein
MRTVPRRAARPTQSAQIKLANSLANGDPSLDTSNRPGAGPGLSWWFGVEPPAGIEPATPSLPSMRGRFTTPYMTFRHYMNVEVDGIVAGWVVRRREAARSAVSGKSLARACTAVHGMDAGAIVRSPAHTRLGTGNYLGVSAQQLEVHGTSGAELRPEACFAACPDSVDRYGRRLGGMLALRRKTFVGS